jgi:phosphatidate cytidylyltransferase
VGIPVIVAGSLAGGFLFSAGVLLVSIVGLFEYYALARAKGAHPQVGTGIILGILTTSGFFFARIRDLLLSLLDRASISVPAPSMTQYFLMLALLFAPLLLAIELFRNKGSALLNIASTVLGTVYVSFFLGALIGIRELFVPGDFPVYAHFSITGVSVSEDVAATIYRWGGYTVVVLFASIWICDSAAYFVGRAFGRHKLFERVSPSKTWEGAIAGFLFGVGSFVLGKVLVLPYLTLGQSVLCGVFVGLFGQLGDLAESLLKRDAGVKDTSRLIPGHGGALDRFDSLLFVSPLLFFYLDFVVF